ncbi:MAG TPA: DUF1295 domain-containing protein [Gemmatimonadaceae bacterium]|nr:DUF1295 domain-containing protein [Gemmatimonadaceae bacterium]HRQ79167.1 DUF1295 domain-containing protein [Gemmatimonadaceae bacterium]
MISAHLIVLGLIIATAVMLTLWAVHLATRNASWVDVGWAATLGILAITYAVFAPGHLPRRILVAAVVGVWSARLTLHLVTRTIGAAEDPRYAEMRERWGGTQGRLGVKFFVLFVGQGLLDVLLALPFLFAAIDTAPQIHPLTWIGAAVAALGMLGEAAADAQLRAFKADPANRGQVCRVGLWGWSRHPNYFFDWLVWCGFALLGIASPWGWTGLLGPALMLYFLTRVTGIAATEAHALRSRGEAYAKYQREVSAFIPRPPTTAR